MLLNILLFTISPYSAIALSGYMAYHVMHEGIIVDQNPWNIGLIFLFVWSFISGVLNNNVASTGASLGILMFFFVSVYMQHYYTDEKSIDKLLKSVVDISLISAVIGILERITTIYCKTVWWGGLFGIPTRTVSKTTYRIYSTFGNPNMAGTCFSALVLICYYLYDTSAGRERKKYAALAFLFLVCLYLTGSRGASIGILFGIITYAFMNRNEKNMGFSAALFISLVVAVFILPQLFTLFKASASPVAGQIVGELNTPMTHNVDNSLTSRWTIWHDCFNMFKMKPITGWGVLGVYFADGSLFHYPTREPHAHNALLSIMVMMGTVGLIIYLYMKKYLFDQIRLLYSRNSSLACLIAAIQALYIGHGLVDFPQMSPQAGMIFVVCSSLTYALNAQYSSSKIYSRGRIVA